MPMAGESKRNKNAFDGPKALMQIAEYPMFYWAAKNINVDKKIFIVQKEHVSKYQIDKIIKDFFPDANIIIQNGKLNGPLLSTMLAYRYIDVEEDIVIMDCDMYSDIDISEFVGLDADASVLIFNSDFQGYSYVAIKDNKIIDIKEKQTISSEAISGVFYWKHGKVFLEYAKKCIAAGNMVNGEFYISGVYHEAIKDNCNIQAVRSNRVYDLSREPERKSFLSSDR